MGDDDWDEGPSKAMDIAISAGAEPAADLPEIKLFGKWSCDEVNVSDMSLQVSGVASSFQFLFCYPKKLVYCK